VIAGSLATSTLCTFVVNPTRTHSEARTRLGASKALAQARVVRKRSHGLEAIRAVVAIEHHSRGTSHHPFEMAPQQQVRFIFVARDLQGVSKLDLFLMGFNDASNSPRAGPAKQEGDEDADGGRNDERIRRSATRRGSIRLFTRAIALFLDDQTVEVRADWLERGGQCCGGRRLHSAES
jgi:pterin-4a-carbinolamine dehydratase